MQMAAKATYIEAANQTGIWPMVKMWALRACSLRMYCSSGDNVSARSRLCLRGVSHRVSWKGMRILLGGSKGGSGSALARHKC